MATPSSIEVRIAKLEGSFEQIDGRLGTLEQDLRSFRSEVNTRMDGFRSEVNTRMDRLMYWQLGLLGAIAGSILTTVLTRVL
jgi:hypothetical protein